jgi:signal transduction histidine kinase
MLLGIVRERDAERTRVARLLHDEIGQVLSAAGLHLDALRLDVQDRAPEIVGRTCEIQSILEGAVQQVRRLSYELCPEPLEHAGIGVALRHLIGRRQPSFSGRLTADCPNSLDLPPAVSAALFRIAEQALDNAVRHSGASRVGLTLRAGRRGTTLEIRDNGRGFDAERMRRRPRGLGLPLMESYAQDAGLVLEIASAPGRDTIVRIIKDRAPGA